MFLNVALCCIQFFRFQFSPQYAYMRVRTREALAFARGPALMINFNTALVLLPICRNLISFVRGCCKCAPRGPCWKRTSPSTSGSHGPSWWAASFTRGHTGTTTSGSPAGKLFLKIIVLEPIFQTKYWFPGPELSGKIGPSLKLYIIL